MKFKLAAAALFCIGYYAGSGALGIGELSYGLVWDNPPARALHDAVLDLEDARLFDFYATLRMDFTLGSVAVLLGFLTAAILPRRLDILPWFFVAGLIARRVAPLAIELIPRVTAAEFVVDFIPRFAWDMALLPACMLGTAVARLCKLRRIPRWRIRSVGILTALLALWLTAGIQSPELWLPLATCGVAGVIAVWLLRQTHATVAGQ